MDYEKLYKEALERAKERHGMAAISQSDLAFIFPELAESDDERIRKELIYYFEEGRDCSSKKEDIIAWLEKQKEPKYLDTSDCEPWSDEQTRRNLINFLKSLGATEIPKASYNSYMKWLGKQGEQKPTWSEEDEEFKNSSIGYLCNLRDSFESQKWDKKPVQKCIDWLMSLRPQPKQEWSEKDEAMRNFIIRIMAKAEERAWGTYPDYPSMDGGYITQRKSRSIFIKGYHQAIEDSCEWIKQQQEMLDDCFSDAGDFADLYRHWYANLLKRINRERRII